MARDAGAADGVTRFGGGFAAKGAIHVEAPRAVGGDGVADKPGTLQLDSVADTGVVTTYYLWVDSAGKLRIANAYPANQDADGTVVGTQA